MQGLQIQLLVGLGWNKACRRPLHGLGHGMGISEIILVPLPKRLRIRGRDLLHIVAKHGKLASNVVRRHSRIGLDPRGAIVLREKVSRGRITSRLANLPPFLIGIEA